MKELFGGREIGAINVLSFDSQKNLKACKTGGRKIPVFHFKGLFWIIVHGTVAHFSRMSVIKAKSEPLPAMPEYI